jgi:hypothetical protein
VTRRIAVLVLVVAATLTSTTPSDAAAGLTYVNSTKKTLQPGDVFVRQSVKCPAGTHVLGGGTHTTGGINKTTVGSSFPFDGGDGNTTPDDGWRSFATNKSDGNEKMQTFAVCTTRNDQSYTATVGIAVPHGGQALGETDCPDGEQVTGGGVEIALHHISIELGGSAPFDDIDPDDSEEDDGWFAAANNTSGEPPTSMTITAICTATGARSYVNAFTPVATGEDEEFEADCPSGTRGIGGGLRMGSFDPSNEVSSTAPLDDADRNSARDDGWRATMSNNSGSPVNIVVSAICRA